MAQIMEFLLNLLLLRGKFFTTKAAATLHEAIKKCLQYKRNLSKEYSEASVITPIDNMMEFINQRSGEYRCEGVVTGEVDHRQPEVPGDRVAAANAEHEVVAKQLQLIEELTKHQHLQAISEWANRDKCPKPEGETSLQLKKDGIVDNLHAIVKSQEFLFKNIIKLIGILERNDVVSNKKKLAKMKKKLVACTDILSNSNVQGKSSSIINNIIEEEITRCRFRSGETKTSAEIDLKGPAPRGIEAALEAPKKKQPETKTTSMKPRKHRPRKNMVEVEVKSSLHDYLKKSESDPAIGVTIKGKTKKPQKSEDASKFIETSEEQFRKFEDKLWHSLTTTKYLSLKEEYLNMCKCAFHNRRQFIATETAIAKKIKEEVGTDNFRKLMDLNESVLRVMDDQKANPFSKLKEPSSEAKIAPKAEPQFPAPTLETTRKNTVAPPPTKLEADLFIPQLAQSHSDTNWRPKTPQPNPEQTKSEPDWRKTAVQPEGQVVWRRSFFDALTAPNRQAPRRSILEELAMKEAPERIVPSRDAVTRNQSIVEDLIDGREKRADTKEALNAILVTLLPETDRKTPKVVEQPTPEQASSESAQVAKKEFLNLDLEVISEEPAKPQKKHDKLGTIVLRPLVPPKAVEETIAEPFMIKNSCTKVNEKVKIKPALAEIQKEHRTKAEAAIVQMLKKSRTEPFETKNHTEGGLRDVVSAPHLEKKTEVVSEQTETKFDVVGPKLESLVFPMCPKEQWKSTLSSYVPETPTGPRNTWKRVLERIVHQPGSRSPKDKQTLAEKYTTIQKIEESLEKQAMAEILEKYTRVSIIPNEDSEPLTVEEKITKLLSVPMENGALLIAPQHDQNEVDTKAVSAKEQQSSAELIEVNQKAFKELEETIRTVKIFVDKPAARSSTRATLETKGPKFDDSTKKSMSTNRMGSYRPADRYKYSDRQATKSSVQTEKTFLKNSAMPPQDQKGAHSMAEHLEVSKSNPQMRRTTKNAMKRQQVVTIFPKVVKSASEKKKSEVSLVETKEMKAVVEKKGSGICRREAILGNVTRPVSSRRHLCNTNSNSRVFRNGSVHCVKWEELKGPEIVKLLRK